MIFIGASQFMADTKLLLGIVTSFQPQPEPFAFFRHIQFDILIEDIMSLAAFCHENKQFMQERRGNQRPSSTFRLKI